MRVFASVRLRVAVAATLVVALALTIGATALVRLQEGSLRKDVETSARLTSREIAARVADGSFGRRLAVPRGESLLAQVVDGSGEIVASSANVSDDPRISTAVPGPSGTKVLTVQGYHEAQHPLRVVARRVTTGGQDYLVYVAASLGSVSRSTASLEQLLAIGLPILALLAGVLSWFVVGRALRPVEAIRREVEVIGGEDLHRRVPEPSVADEIGRLAHTMNAMLGRLEIATERQQRFVADASHELRSPLTGIRAQLEVDLAYGDRADWSQTAAEVLDDTIRLQRLVDDLLLLAAADASALDRAHVALDLDEIVLAEARRARNATAIPIDTTAVSGAQVRGNADQLGRAVRNLLDNAGRHAASRIEVTLVETDGNAVLTVADDGPGVPPEERDRIFERFARHDASRRRADGGTGLGLAIVREVATAHDGTIELAPGPGARFILRLPLPAEVR